MNDKPLGKSRLLGPLDPPPEMTVEHFVRLIQTAFTLTTKLDGPFLKVSGYLDDPVRIASIWLPTHDKNGVSISGLVIRQALAKFGLTEDEFRQAYNGLVEQSA